MSDELFTATDTGEIEEPEQDLSGWVEVKSGEPIEDVLAHYLCEEPWKKSDAGRFDVRPECQAFMIRDPKSKSTIYTWNSKQSDMSVGEAVADFIGEYLGDDEQARTERLWVSRSPMPDLREWDSSRVFTVANASQVESSSGVPALPLPPPSFAPRPVPSGPSPVQITGNVMADYNLMLQSCFDFMWRWMEVDQQRRERSLQIDYWSLQQVADTMRKSPDAAVRREEMKHEYDMKRLELEAASKGQVAKEVGGIVTDFAGQLAGTPMGQRWLEGIGGKLGLFGGSGGDSE